MREFHAGAQRDLPEVQYVREHDGVFVIVPRAQIDDGIDVDQSRSLSH